MKNFALGYFEGNYFRKHKRAHCWCHGIPGKCYCDKTYRISLYFSTALSFCNDFVIDLHSYLLLTGNLGGKVYF